MQGTKVTNKKTIFVVISKNIMRRNILETEFWTNFVSQMKDHQIVLIGEAGERELYEEKFGAENVVIENVSDYQTSLWHKLVLFLVRTGTNTKGVRLYRWRSYTMRQASWGSTMLKVLLASTVANFSWYHNLLRKVYGKLSAAWIEELFDTYQPDLVFASALVDIKYDALIGATAKRRGVRVVGMVRSWDNMAIHGLLPFVPDTFIFQNKWLEECATKLQSMDLSNTRTSIIGLPHYDYYRYPEKFVKPKEDFLRENNLDPTKKLILLGGFDFYWSEDVLPKKLDQAIEEGKIDEPVQVVFRPHPSTPFEISDYNIDSLKHTTLNAPFLDKRTAFNDKDFFINLVYHCDVLINVASTLAIDGAVFDRPVICINFDDESKSLPKWKRVGRLFDSFDHYEALMKTGSAKVPTSFAGMIANINEYLEDPTIDHKNRLAAIEKFVAPFEGDSGERLLKEVLAEVNEV